MYTGVSKAPTDCGPDAMGPMLTAVSAKSPMPRRATTRLRFWSANYDFEADEVPRALYLSLSLILTSYARSLKLKAKSCFVFWLWVAHCTTALEI